MTQRIMVSITILTLMAVLIGGATMAWFTAQAEITDNVFQAGTLTIDAQETWAYESGPLTNWNPVFNGTSNKNLKIGAGLLQGMPE